MRRPNDIGGLPAGPVDPATHAEAPWEKLSVALSGAINRPGRRIYLLDEARRQSEERGEENYNRLKYFERSVQTTADLLVEKGVLTRDEIEDRIKLIEARMRAEREGGR